MATANQIAANQANAQKSSGPKTETGKAKSSLNHLSHGFTSATARLIPDEDPQEFKALLADLMSEYQPATPTEQILVERMTQNQWLSQRAFRLQSTAFFHKGYGLGPITISQDLGLLIRYQTAADRAFHRAHTDLVKAQKERKKSEIGFESKNAAELPETPAQQPAPPQKAPAPPPILSDLDFLEGQLTALIDEADLEMAKKHIADIRTRRQAA